MSMTNEQAQALGWFMYLLTEPTLDGGSKLVRGEKVPWQQDRTHLEALFSHLNKYMHGEKKDPDSGSHPMVHLAWRALAVAWQETFGEDPYVEPKVEKEEAPKISPGAVVRIPEGLSVEDVSRLFLYGDWEKASDRSTCHKTGCTRHSDATPSTHRPSRATREEDTAHAVQSGVATER